MEQATQVPVQPVSQHTPSTQARDEHSLPVVQAAPFDFRATHAPLAQWLVVGQSVSTVHPWRQPSAVHAAVLQSIAMGAVHIPLVQTRAAVNMVPEHVGSPHFVVASYFRHAPLPSHVPSRPHIAGGSAGHSSSGSFPDWTGWQLPLR
jgi:hypothetical protein